MRSHNTTTRTTALALVLLLTFCTLPLSAADKTANATIGSVSSIGSVQLRGVPLSSDGTLFSGDRLNVGPGSYARVNAGGHKLEVGANSDVVLSREGDNATLQLASGNVAFKGNGKGTTRVRIGAYDIAVSPDATGSIALVGSQAFGVRLTSGSATVRNAQTRKSFVVEKGAERLVSLMTGDSSPTMAQLASAVPSAVPATALPRRQASSWSTGMWVGVVVAAASSASLVTYFLAREDDEDRTDQVKFLANTSAMAQTAAQVSTVSAQSASLAAQAQAAINASSISTANKNLLLSQVATTVSQANSAATKIAALTPKIAALQNQIASQEDGPTAAQSAELSQLLTDLNNARADANASINSLNALLSQANSLGVTGLPSSSGLQPVQPPTIASASVPV